MDTAKVTKLEEAIREQFERKSTRETIMRVLGKKDRPYEEIIEMLIKGQSEEAKAFLKNMTDKGLSALVRDIEKLWILRKGGHMQETKETRGKQKQKEKEEMGQLVHQMQMTENLNIETKRREEQHLKELRKREDMFKQELAKSDESRKRLHQMIENLSIETKRREEQHLKELREREDNLKQELAKKDESHKQEIRNLIDEVRKSNEINKTDFARLRTEITCFKKDVTDGFKKFSDFKAEIESSYDALHSSAEDTENETFLTEIRKESDEYKLKSVELEEKYKDLREKVAKESGEISAKCTELEKERDDLEKKLRKEKKDKNRIEESCNRLRHEKESLEKEMHDLKAKHDALLEKLQSVDQHRAGMYLKYRNKYLH